MDYKIGDIVKTKKQHPCGSKLWEIARVGVDFKLKCLGCGHIVTMERQKALKVSMRRRPYTKKWPDDGTCQSQTSHGFHAKSPSKKTKCPPPFRQRGHT